MPHSRRKFLTIMGAVGASSLLSSCANLPFGQEIKSDVAIANPARLLTGDVLQGRIDTHHHLVPPIYRETMHKHGIKDVAGKTLPNWQPQDSINIMNQIGTQTAILSLSAPGVYFGNINEATHLARACNEYAYNLTQEYKGRFGYFAVLPMPFTEESCKEAIYALDELHADGIVLLGSTEGVFLGDKKLDELMAELNKRKAVVFIHPNLHKTTEQLNIDLPGFMLEFLPDTTRAAMNLIITGTLDKYPDIRWILAHAGGFLPYVAWRMSLDNLMPKETAHLSKGILAYIKDFYYDTALSASSYAMGALVDLVGVEKVLFGSDYAFAPAILSKVQAESLDNLAVFKGKQYQLQRGNALTLFPRLKNANERASETPLFYQESGANKLKRAISKPAVNVVESLRNR